MYRSSSLPLTARYNGHGVLAVLVTASFLAWLMRGREVSATGGVGSPL